MGSKDLDQVYWGGEIERLVDYGGGRLTVRAIKLFTDGKSFLIPFAMMYLFPK